MMSPSLAVSKRTRGRLCGGLANFASECVGEYAGVVRVRRRVFQRLLDQAATPERCLEAFHLQRTRFEIVVERKLHRRQLTDDGNIEITGRDLRKTEPRKAADQIAFEWIVG